MWLREDIGALGHEVHAAEEDELGLGAASGLLGELEGIAPEVRELDDFVALVVMTEDHEILAELALQAPDLLVTFWSGHLEVFARNLLLMRRSDAVATQQRVGANRFFGDA